MQVMLEHMVRRLLPKREFEEAVQVVLDDVIALHGAEYGNLQWLVHDHLVIVAQRGLSNAFLRTFRYVEKDDGSACGRALRLGKPVVIPDVEHDAEFAGFRRDAAMAGFRAVQSTPLVTTDGVALGVVSTHFAQVHTPSPIETQTLKEYSRAAADHLYRMQDGVSLEERSQRMNEKLYAGVSGVPIDPTVEPDRKPDHPA